MKVSFHNYKRGWNREIGREIERYWEIERESESERERERERKRERVREKRERNREKKRERNISIFDISCTLWFIFDQTVVQIYLFLILDNIPAQKKILEILLNFFFKERIKYNTFKFDNAEI